MSEQGDPGASLKRAVAEYRKLPGGDDVGGFRWGFLGAWGDATEQGAQHACLSVHTTTLETFLSTRTENEVAQFAEVFTDAAALRICGYLFRHDGQVTEQDLRDDCDLSEAELNASLQTLLAWRLVERQGDIITACGQGVNFAMTLTGMAIEGYKQRRGGDV